MFFDSWQSSVASVCLSFLGGKNCVLDPEINLATLILRFLKFKRGLIKNDDMFCLLKS